MNFDFTCTQPRILLDLPHLIWEMQTGDGQGGVLLTRFLHNWPLFLANNLLRCYLSYFSPDYLAGTVTIIGVILFSIGLMTLIHKHQWLWLLLVLAAPLSPLFEFPVNSTIRGLLLWGSWGLTIAVGIFTVVTKLQQSIMKIGNKANR